MFSQMDVHSDLLFLGKIATNFFQIENFCRYLNRNFFTSLHESTLKCIYICRVSTVPICIYCFIWNSHLGGMKISNGFQMDWVIHFHKIKSTKGCELFNNNTFPKMDLPFHIRRCAPISVWNQHTKMCLHLNTEWVHLKYLLLGLPKLLLDKSERWTFKRKSPFFI